MKTILAVETSCDDTSVAIVEESGFVRCCLTAQQDEVHQLYGGVVPELACRNHNYHLLPLINQALTNHHIHWDDIDALAVTNRPGLVGSLMVGLVTVKTLALALNKPYIAINHIEGHILSPFLWDKIHPCIPDVTCPFLALIVSGSHSSLFIVNKLGYYYLIARTVDDAAGEVLDKLARSLGLPYPGGAEIDKLSQKATVGKYTFPKVKFKKNCLNFSFSGLKTKGHFMIQEHKKKQTKKTTSKDKKWIAELCADYQEAIVNQLMDRLDKASSFFNIKNIVIAGGVSANSCLRRKALTWAQKKSFRLILPQKKYCTDNAAMIAKAGFRFLSQKKYSAFDLNCYPHHLPEDFIDISHKPLESLKKLF